MAHGKMETLLFLSFSLHLTLAVTHSLQYIYTAVTPGINFPEFTDVGQLDGEQFVYYDSNIRRYIPKTEWMEKNAEDDYWNTQTQSQQDQEEIFKRNIVTAMKRFNQTKGVHTIQRMYGCELDDDGTVRGYDQLGYDGEDFVSLDLKTQTWIAPKSQAVITKNKWDRTGLASYDRNYLENECVKWLKKYLTYGRETVERKVPPEVSVVQKHSSPSPEVVCHATGFFPRGVMIIWQKDGEDVHEDVELRETLPNQDGSFQKRSILKVPAEELQEHTYTCVVQQKGSEDIVREIPTGGAPIAIIVGVIVALLVLAAVVAGVVIYKKKNSGFKHVPAKLSSDDDSSSNNS